MSDSKNSRSNKAQASLAYFTLRHAFVVLGCFLILSIWMPARADLASPALVQTIEGPVQGFAKNGITEFLGIPYATPPVGNLRWTPPQKHARWDKPLKADAYGPTCAQITTLGVFAGSANKNEDCLYLNVFTPALAEPRGADGHQMRLPVIFWIHGGNNIDGESNDYDGSKLALQGHIVVVTINYRLGLLGFFAHPAIDKEGHLFGNYGILDQQLALKWVQNNIAAFGGDPNNVTVGGQSAGSFNTEAHVISPLSMGLFRHAIFQSLVHEPAPLTSAETAAIAFGKTAGCGSAATPAVAVCLRKLSAAQIMSLQGTERANGPYVVKPDGLIQDGQILPARTFAMAIRAGQFNRVPIMSGNTEDEWNFVLGIQEYFENPHAPLTPRDYTSIINSTFAGSEGPYGSGTFPSGTPAAVMMHYPLRAYGTPQLALDRILTDPFECGQRYINTLLAEYVPVYAYEFDDRTAPFYFPVMPGFQPLAYHTGDIQYLFPHFHGSPHGIVHSFNQQQNILSDELVASWANFARTGDPNGHTNSTSLVPVHNKALWPLYAPGKPDAPSILSQNIPALSVFTDAQFAGAHQCNFWDSILTY